MTAYVDEIRDWTLVAKGRGLRHTHWCHLTADTEAELHTFAAKIGLRRSWYQKKSDRDYRWHYDLVPSKRAQAVRLGAVEVDRQFVGQLMIRRQRERDCAGELPRTGPPCGNNPTTRLTPGDQQVVDEFQAYLKKTHTDGAGPGTEEGSSMTSRFGDGNRVLRIAACLVTEGARHGSPSMLVRRMHQDHGIIITFSTARHVFDRLRAAGVLGPADPDTHAHPVLLDQGDALDAVDRFTEAGETQ